MTTALSFQDATILSLGALFLGIIMLIKGGNWAVDAAVFIARRYGISPMVVGFTIIAFGTSLPELIVSVYANLQGSPGIALGNVLGSNIANVFMVLGFSALLVTLRTNVTKLLVRDLGFMIVATVFLAGLLHYGEISQGIGFLMIAILLSYVFLQYKTTKADEFEAGEIDEMESVFQNELMAYGTLLLGLICIAVGAEFLVRGAKVSAGLIGVPEDVIGLTVIAFGTSLPELSTSIIAVRKGQTDMVIGNVIGSNVFNILMILGCTSMIKPIADGSFAPQLASFDVWITLAVSIIFTLVLLLFGRINRLTGCLFFSSYVAYNAYIYMSNVG
ncbi:MAG: calcium/sodium antiporter [Alphaproteobacteria bacterium]